MIVLHVDMDAFFASVEQRDHPEWQGKPVIVGAGPHERGVVSTCSYEARKFGVHSAMPSRTAYALCPKGIFVSPRMKVYESVSSIAFSVFASYSPFVEGVSIDEAFLDITGTAHLFGGMIPLAEKLRTEIHERCGVTCSVGLAPNRLLAKIASEEHKPNGLFVTPFEPEAIRAYLAPKPVSAIWGVGTKTANILQRYGYCTCGDLQKADLRFLERTIGETLAQSIVNHANGIDFTLVDSGEGEEKSVSREYTFSVDAVNRDEVRAKLLELLEDVGRRFRSEEGRWAKTVKLKLRDGAFNTLTRQFSLPRPARDDITFRHATIELFNREWPTSLHRTIRLIGVGVTNFTDMPEDEGADLFGPSKLDETMRKRERLSAALDILRNQNYHI